MKKNVYKIAGIAISVLIAILLTKCFSGKSDSYNYDTVKVERGNIINAVTATGTLQAITTVEVGTQVSGIIEHIYVDFNDYVKQGQVLARLDETSLVAQVQQSQASVDQAQAQLVYQEATYQRMKTLYEKNLIAKADYDQALFNYENSKASLSNANSALDRAKVQLAYATIYSPIDGVVLNRAVEEGQTVAASFNTPEMFTIARDLTRMEVQTSVDEADIGQVREGQRVEFTVDAYPELKFEGTVSQVRFKPVTTNNVVTYTVILNAPNPEKKLMPGMTASATIYVEEKHNTLVLPGKALRFVPDADYLKSAMGKDGQSGFSQGRTLPGFSQDPVSGQIFSGQPVATGFSTTMQGDMKMVWVRNENSGIKPVPVTVGLENGSSVEILAGLNQGDEVVVSMTGKNSKASSGRPGGPPMMF